MSIKHEGLEKAIKEAAQAIKKAKKPYKGREPYMTKEGMYKMKDAISTLIGKEKAKKRVNANLPKRKREIAKKIEELGEDSPEVKAIIAEYDAEGNIANVAKKPTKKRKPKKKPTTEI